jgi:hypothetical protein
MMANDRRSPGPRGIPHVLHVSFDGLDIYLRTLAAWADTHAISSYRTPAVFDASLRSSRTRERQIDLPAGFFTLFSDGFQSRATWCSTSFVWSSK